MAKTVKFQGLSLEQVESEVKRDPALFKDAVPLGPAAILRVGIIFSALWMVASIYSLFSYHSTINFESIAAAAIVPLIIMAFLAFAARARGTLKSRLASSYLAGELEIQHEQNKILMLTVGREIWKDVPGLTGPPARITRLRFSDYKSGNSIMYVLCKSPRPTAGPLERPYLVLNHDEKQRLVSLLSSFKNINIGAQAPKDAFYFS